MLIDHHDQQIVLQKARNLDLCFGTNLGTNQAKIEKISISQPYFAARTARARPCGFAIWHSEWT